MSEEETPQDFLFVIEDEQPKHSKAEPVKLAEEPLFTALLRDAVAKLWPDDPVMADFVTHVARPLSDRLAGVGAKGGNFILKRLAEGKRVETRYLADQSQRAHLINGLFPTLHVARTLQAWSAPQFRYYDEATRRLFVAGYVLHDYLKLPGAEKQLEEAGFGHESAVGAAQMPTLEAIFREWCTALGLDVFLSPLGGPEAVLHDLIYVACNTQTRWGTLRNLSLLKRLTLVPPQLDLAEQLSRLADLLAYVARTPQAVAADATLHRELAQLSNGMARFICHHLADNRGLLTNFIHDAALGAMQHKYRVPLLYAPSGVVYLEHKESAPPLPTAVDVTQATIQHIREIISTGLQRTRSGMKRDGKGMKYADFYWLFFDLPAFVLLGLQATFDVIHEGKKPSSGKRFAKMRDGGWMASEVDLDLPDDLRVDQLAEWCYLAEKQVAARLPEFDTAELLLQMLDLQDLRVQFKAVPRDNRAGGVGYHWYFAAGHYLKRHPGLDPAAWHERMEEFAKELSRAVAAVPQQEAQTDDHTDWDDLQDYVAQTLALGPAKKDTGRAVFAAEFQRYTNAKRRGRGTTQVCALCSSPYRVDKQQEAAVLFAPQVYSNKQPLHGTDALRSICSICSLEMMLRQLLMNHSAATGGDFEGQRVRYLYFYPTYFFTPETLSVLRRAYVSLKTISFTELRRQLVQDGTVDLSPATWQRLEPLLLTPEEEVDPAQDRHVRFHFAETEPVTFYFLGLKPGRDAKDAEAWVHPAFLALLLPLCLDVKVVASESSLPLLLEADEIAETVFLHGPHAAIRYLTSGEMRVNVDQVLSTLQRLAVGYLIHLDANSGMGRGGYDYRWQNLPAVARDLGTSPLYAFHYLKKWQRQKGLDTLPGSKVRQYLDYVQTYLEGGNAMSHARELTRLYRQFYRASRTSLSAHNVLRPLSLAARAMLDADPRLFADDESLVEVVYGELHARIEGAAERRQFYFPRGSTAGSREQAIRAFADYFVRQVFQDALRGDKSALRGKQLNLLRNACEVVYHEMEAQERSASESETDDASTKG